MLNLTVERTDPRKHVINKTWSEWEGDQDSRGYV
jgi:hypothetical protein